MTDRALVTGAGAGDEVGAACEGGADVGDIKKVADEDVRPRPFATTRRGRRRGERKPGPEP